MVYFAANSTAANGKKVAAIGLAASGFAANCLNLGGPQKPGRCKWICCKCTYTIETTNMMEISGFYPIQCVPFETTVLPPIIGGQITSEEFLPSSV